MFGVPLYRQSLKSWNEAALACSQMWMASNEVIWHRSLQMMTGTMSPSEATRMVLEKPIAFARAVQGASEAVAQGQDPGRIAHAAVTPICIEAHSNARRLGG